MTFPDVHLAGEAVAAFVDGELTPVAHARALAHLDVCTECRGAVRVQQEAASVLTGAPDPALPESLIARLRDIPMTTDLGNADVVLAVDGDDLVWGTPSSLRGRARAAVAPQLLPGPGRGGGATRSVRAPQGRPPQPSAAERRQLPGRPGRPPGRPRRVRRVLAGAVAGIALGVFAATAPTATSGVGVAPDRNNLRGVNGGVVDPPVFGGVSGVRDIRGPGLDEGGLGGAAPFGDTSGSRLSANAGTSASRSQDRVVWTGVLVGVGQGRRAGLTKGPTMR